MTTIQGDYTYDDLKRLDGILEAHQQGGYISLQDDDVALLQRLFVSFIVAISKPKMEEPTEDYIVVEADAPADSIKSRSRYRFVRDNTRLACRWLCFENAQFYEWDHLNNPEVIQ